MTRRSFVSCLALVFALPAPAHPAPRASEDGPPSSTSRRPPVRVYTNEDLDRVHPLRGETGVASVPAVEPGEALPEAPARGRGRGEEYWRREAARVRERVRRLEADASELRAQIAAEAAEAAGLSSPGRKRRGTAAASSAARLRARLAGLERRIRDAEDELADRARREGALPGWLRE